MLKYAAHWGAQMGELCKLPQTAKAKARWSLSPSFHLQANVGEGHVGDEEGHREAHGGEEPDHVHVLQAHAQRWV